MFKAISWGQFTGVLLLVLLLYYAYVGLTYYRAELLNLARGKGMSTEPVPAPARSLASLVGKGPLIAKPAIPRPASPAQQEASPAAAPPEEPEESDLPEEEAELETAAPDAEAGELPDLDLPAGEVAESLSDGKTIQGELIDGNTISFTEQEDVNSFHGIAGGVETAPEEYDPSLTIGVAQLGSYFERATEGQLTQDSIVEQEPALANTELLVSFFQASNKNAQRATARLFAEVEAPAPD